MKTKRLQIIGNFSPTGELPSVSKEDEGKILKVVDGEWVADELPVYDGEFSVTPNAHNDVMLATSQTYMDSDVKVLKIPYSEVTNPAKGKTVTIG
jgi:hypothetical protein